MYEKLGVDIGCDSQNDFSYADQLSGLLNAMDQKNHLPRTILYYLNPKDAAMLSTMAGNYQGNEEQIRGNGTANGYAVRYRTHFHLCWNAHRLKKFPLFSKTRIFPQNSLQ